MTIEPGTRETLTAAPVDERLTTNGTVDRVVGAPSDPAPMLLNLSGWGVEQALWLPGQEGNYASIPDVNLLDADNAHIVQSVGDWLANSGTLTLSTEEAFFGPSSLKAVPTSGETTLAKTATYGQIPIEASTQYTASIWVKPMNESGIRIVSRDYEGATGQTSVIGTSVICPAGEWTQVFVTWTSTAAADSVRLFAYITDTGGADGTEAFYLDAICLREGTDPTFVPSTRIVGDIDLRAEIILPETPSARASVVSTHTATGTQGAELQVNTDRSMVVVHGDGSSQAARFLGANTVIPFDEPVHVRATLDVDNGAGEHTWKVYHSSDGVTWELMQQITLSGATQIGATIPGASAGRRAGGGFYLKSVIHGFEIRDGVDGPIVASADFTDPSEVSGDQWVTPEGHAAQINRSGDATAELVDRDCWAFTGSEWLRIPHREDIDFGAGDDFEVAVGLASRAKPAGGNEHFILDKWSGAVNTGGWRFRGWTSPQYALRVRQQDGTIVTATAAGVYDGSWEVIAARRANGNIVVSADGVDGVAAATQNATLENSTPLSVGGGGGTGSFAGLVDWTAIFRRALTSTERNTLAAWDGRVSTEPAWLRDDPDLALYLNANDPETADAYAAGDVLDRGYGVVTGPSIVPDGTVAAVRVALTASAGSDARPQVRFGDGAWTDVDADTYVIPDQSADESLVASRVLLTTGTVEDVTLEVVPLATLFLARAYNRLPAFYRQADRDHDQALLRFMSLIFDQGGDIETLFDRINGDSGTSDLVDPQTMDPEWRHWLAQLVGVDLKPSLTEAEWRDALQYASAGWRAGTRTAIGDAARSVLTGDKYAKVYARTTTLSDKGGATEWDILVVTRDSETPAPGDVLDAITRQGAKPAGTVLRHESYSATWNTIEAQRPTWDDWDGDEWYEIEETT